MVPESPERRVTELVRRLSDGDSTVAEELLPLVYDQLCAIANGMFARQPEGHTLQPTALVHEAWLKLAGSGQQWEGRTHFFAVAAKAMRQVLTDHARARRTDRRGKGWRKMTFDEQVIGESKDYDLVDLDDALQNLSLANERYARVVELRLFGGLTVDEVAKELSLTPRTIKLDWRSARAWLRHALEGPRLA
jgi:RNA polymerase sigma factor (TIGR02999 family)